MLEIVKQNLRIFALAILAPRTICSRGHVATASDVAIGRIGDIDGLKGTRVQP
jgi:hypothetical protein